MTIQDRNGLYQSLSEQFHLNNENLLSADAQVRLEVLKDEENIAHAIAALRPFSPEELQNAFITKYSANIHFGNQVANAMVTNPLATRAQLLQIVVNCALAMEISKQWRTVRAQYANVLSNDQSANAANQTTSTPASTHKIRKRIEKNVAIDLLQLVVNKPNDPCPLHSTSKSHTGAECKVLKEAKKFYKIK